MRVPSALYLVALATLTVLCGPAVASSPVLDTGLSRIARPPAPTLPRPDAAQLKEIERLVRCYHARGDRLPLRAYASVGDILTELADADSWFEAVPGSESSTAGDAQAVRELAPDGQPAEYAFPWHGLKVTTRDGLAIVTGAVDGRAAATAGLRPRDVILSVNGRGTHGVPAGIVCGWVNAASTPLVDLQVHRPGETGTRAITLTRQRPGRMEPRSRVLSDGTLVLAIPGFERGMALQVSSRLAAARRTSRLTGVVLDLRGCPGGFMVEMVQVARLLLATGTCVARTERERAVHQVTGPGASWKLAVLVDEATSGCAEVLAASIRESGSGLVLGAPTFGKTTVQWRMRLPDRSVLNLTVDTLLTGKHDRLSHGVVPDVVIGLGVEPEARRALEPALDDVLARAVRGVRGLHLTQ